MLTLDHIAITATRLDEGVEAVEAALGVSLQGGGVHVKMGTHNRLLHLGDLYLEVIAPDPAQPHPGRPRWFDLDRFSGPPRPSVWLTRTETLEADLATSPPGIGQPIAMERNGFSWQIVVPETGILPFGNVFPALIQWDKTSPRPVDRLADLGLSLLRLEVASPEAPALRAALSGRFSDPRVAIVEADSPALRLTIQTPHGIRLL